MAVITKSLIFSTKQQKTRKRLFVILDQKISLSYDPTRIAWLFKQIPELKKEYNCIWGIMRTAEVHFDG